MMYIEAQEGVVSAVNGSRRWLLTHGTDGKLRAIPDHKTGSLAMTDHELHTFNAILSTCPEFVIREQMRFVANHAARLEEEAERAKRASKRFQGIFSRKELIYKQIKKDATLSYIFPEDE